jgi:enoyl-CoA hydratase/carnithine racemase
MHRVIQVVSSLDNAILFECRDSIAHIVLNRPKTLNALDMNMMKDILEKLNVNYGK